MKRFLDLAMRFRSTGILDDEFPRLRHEFDSALTRLLETLPKIVCLCGSTRFKEAFDEANYQETMAGNIILSVGFYMHATGNRHGEGIGATPEQKVALDELHKRKIDLADEILVLNVGGYIGDSTRSEIAYAQASNKPVRWLETPTTVSDRKESDSTIASRD